MTQKVCLVILATLAMFVAQSASAASPTSDEMAEAHKWVAAKFASTPVSKEPDALIPGLRVLANNDPVQLNSRGEQLQVSTGSLPAGCTATPSAK